jgi:hypothetical protein
MVPAIHLTHEVPIENRKTLVTKLPFALPFSLPSIGSSKSLAPKKKKLSTNLARQKQKISSARVSLDPIRSPQR